MDFLRSLSMWISRVVIVSIAQARCFGFLPKNDPTMTTPLFLFQSLRRDVLDSYVAKSGSGGHDDLSFQSLRRDVLDSYTTTNTDYSTIMPSFNRSGAMFWIPTRRGSRAYPQYCRVSIAQARCFWIPYYQRAGRASVVAAKFQSLRRDVLDSYVAAKTKRKLLDNVSIAQARCFGFLLWVVYRAVAFLRVSIAQARCFGFLHNVRRRHIARRRQFQSLRRDVFGFLRAA